MYISNHYIGADMYVIRFENGTHCIVDDFDNRIFQGTYEACVSKLNDMWVRHQEDTIW